MENKPDNIKFTVTIPANFPCTYTVLVDGTKPTECEETKNEFIYTFLLPRGQYTVEIVSIPTAKHGIGKLRAEFLSASSKKRYLNHLFAFHYDISCFSMKIDLRIHRDAHLKLGIKRKYYSNFLHVDGTYLSPYISDCQNIKQESVTVNYLYSNKIQKRFYRKQAVLWTLYCFALVAIYAAFAVTDIRNWSIDSGYAGHTGKSLLLLGSFPVVVLVIISYCYCMRDLYRQYKNGFLF